MENDQNNQNQSLETTTPVNSVPKQEDYTFDDTTIMASLSYLGPLVLIPFLTKRDNAFIMFHVRQGLVLFGIEIALMFVNMMSFFMLTPIIGLINICLLILSIIGILNAFRMKEAEIPLVGKWAGKISI